MTTDTMATSSVRIQAVSDLMRIPRQYGTLLVMLPTLWSLFLAADGRPSLSLLLIFIFGSFIMRSAGCVINDMADRNFDPLVERTKGRPLASNRMSVRAALIVLAALLSIALGLAFMLNRTAFLLCFPGALLAMIYPFTKRYIQIPQAVMGIAFGWGSVIAWAAVRGTVEIQAFLIFFATALWATAYDTLYALQDIDDDRKIGVKSSAIFFGRKV
ncbi:MAG: UbiA family prenyltransferase, partial [Nitrospirota bacterium]|nr:UbiA family prenyltransferase [Nitrospirota bacterium]